MAYWPCVTLHIIKVSRLSSDWSTFNNDFLTQISKLSNSLFHFFSLITCKIHKISHKLSDFIYFHNQIFTTTHLFLNPQPDLLFFNNLPTLRSWSENRGKVSIGTPLIEEPHNTFNWSHSHHGKKKPQIALPLLQLRSFRWSNPQKSTTH